MPIWYYTKDGQRCGPVSAGELKKIALEGALKRTDLIWKEGMDNWISAGSVKGLFSEPAVPPPLQVQKTPPLLPTDISVLATNSGGSAGSYSRQESLREERGGLMSAGAAGSVEGVIVKTTISINYKRIGLFSVLLLIAEIFMGFVVGLTNSYLRHIGQDDGQLMAVVEFISGFAIQVGVFSLLASKQKDAIWSYTLLISITYWVLCYPGDVLLAGMSTGNWAKSILLTLFLAAPIGVAIGSMLRKKSELNALRA